MVEVVAGRRYAVVHPSGKREEGVAVLSESGSFRFRIGQWYVDPDGTVPCTNLRVEAIAPPAAPSTEAVHAQDAELLDGLPPHSETRLRVRQIQALERAADALETIACLAFDAFGSSDEEDDEVDAADAADETGTAQ